MHSQSNYDGYLLSDVNSHDLETGNNIDPCLICTREDKSMYKLTCDHVFCKSCIRRWLTHNKTCPICRRAACIIDMSPLREEDDTCKNCCGNKCYLCKISCQKEWYSLLCSIICVLVILVLIGGVLLLFVAMFGGIK